MATRLDKLPAEILENVLLYLQVADICSVRLTNQALQQKATLRRFRNSFQRKHLYLTPKSLGDFIEVSKPSRLGCLIEELSLYGLAIDYDDLACTVEKGSITRRQLSGFISMSYEEPLSATGRRKARSDLDVLTRLQDANQQLYKSGEAVRMLAQAFRNLAANSPTRHLRRLSLEVSCLADDPAKRLQPAQFADFVRIKNIWATATQLFHVTMAALAESNLLVEELVLFNSPSYLCSLFRDQLRLLDFPKLDSLTSHLTALSLSLSAREPILRVEYELDVQLTTKVPDDFVGLGMLLAQCPMLRHLDIHCYSADYSVQPPLNDTVVPEFAVSGRSSNNLDWKLLALEELIIAGLTVREEDLLEFLKRARPARLELECIKIVDGSFQPIFDFCSTSNPKLTSINLGSLYETEMLWFPGSGPSELEVYTRPSDPRPGTISLIREGDDVRLPILYHFPGNVQVRCATNNVYYRQMARRFGPFTKMIPQG